MTGRTLSVGLVFVVAASYQVCGGAAKNVGPPSKPLEGHYWDGPFRPTPAFGSYNSIFRKPDGSYEMWNNTIGDGPKDGLVRLTSKNLTEWGPPEVQVPHEIIDDVFDKTGQLSAKRRYTRPSVFFHPADGYFVVAHVCDGYPPRQSSVYPAFITSKTGEKDTWVYHGKLRGEIEEFWPGKKSRWADGRGLFYQPQYPARVDDAEPIQNRFLFFSNQYPGTGCLALLYSGDGKTWKFHRENGKIANLLPVPLREKGIIFPQVIRAGKRGWYAWLSEKWPPVAIWRIHSDDGLHWRLFGKRQPEIVKPPDCSIKTVSAWYDAPNDVLHGYLASWEKIGDVMNYRLYHSTSRKFAPAD